MFVYDSGRRPTFSKRLPRSLYGYDLGRRPSRVLETYISLLIRLRRGLPTLSAWVDDVSFWAASEAPAGRGNGPPARGSLSIHTLVAEISTWMVDDVDYVDDDDKWTMALCALIARGCFFGIFGDCGSKSKW